MKLLSQSVWAWPGLCGGKGSLTDLINENIWTIRMSAKSMGYCHLCHVISQFTVNNSLMKWPLTYFDPTQTPVILMYEHQK